MKPKKIISWVLFLSGICLLLFAIFYPTSSWYLSWLLRPASLFDPSQTSTRPIPKFLNSQGFYEDVQMSDAANWFPDYHPKETATVSASSFLLSIPSVKMQDIPIKVNGSDLKASPIHYPGTVLPGQIGNSVILGHSALPHLYWLKSPLAIFNPIIKVKAGDTIDTNLNGISYHYKVTKIFEVTPDKIEVLKDTPDRRQITLITCVPFGTYLRRLVLIGELIN